MKLLSLLAIIILALIQCDITNSTKKDEDGQQIRLKHKIVISRTFYTVTDTLQNNTPLSDSESIYLDTLYWAFPDTIIFNSDNGIQFHYSSLLKDKKQIDSAYNESISYKEENGSISIYLADTLGFKFKGNKQTFYETVWWIKGKSSVKIQNGETINIDEILKDLTEPTDTVKCVKLKYEYK